MRHAYKLVRLVHGSGSVGGAHRFLIEIARVARDLLIKMSSLAAIFLQRVREDQDAAAA